MPKKDNLFIGILAGLILPAFAFGIAYLLRDNITIVNKPALPYLAAIALNLILMRYCIRKELDQTSRGIMFTTFVCMLLIFILKSHIRL